VVVITIATFVVMEKCEERKRKSVTVQYLNFAVQEWSDVMIMMTLGTRTLK
jgi:hypothetical protein